MIPLHGFSHTHYFLHNGHRFTGGRECINASLACYFCIVNPLNPPNPSNPSNNIRAADGTPLRDAFNQAYYTAIARERYIQRRTIGMTPIIGP